MVELIRQVNLRSYFEEQLVSLPITSESRAYVVSLLTDYKSSEKDLSRESLVLFYSRARETGSFEKFQQLGDWALWTMALAPESLSEMSLAEDLGRLSYYRCWSILKGSWRLYEELADRLPHVATSVRNSVVSSAKDCTRVPLGGIIY